MKNINKISLSLKIFLFLLFYNNYLYSQCFTSSSNNCTTFTSSPSCALQYPVYCRDIPTLIFFEYLIVLTQTSWGGRDWTCEKQNWGIINSKIGIHFFMHPKIEKYCIKSHLKNKKKISCYLE